MKLTYVGEDVYGQTIQRSFDPYKDSFPQRRMHILGGLKRLGHDVQTSLFNPTMDRATVPGAVQIPDGIRIIDNPLFSLFLPDVAVFENIDWYAEMRLREFGEDKQYHLLRYAEIHANESAQLVIAQGAYNKEFSQQYNKNVIMIPNGVDTELFYPSKTPRDREGDDPFRLLFVGKLNEWYENILQIAAAVDEFNGAVELVVVGTGTLYNNLLQFKNTTLLGTVPYSDIPGLMRDCDVCVFTTNDDSPLVIAEYMASGKPILTVEGRIDWLVKNEENGFLVPPNVIGYKTGIEMMMENPDRIQKMGERNRQKAIDDLQWKNLLVKYDMALKGLSI